ncbi:MAG: M48 family metallopeptidase [Tabrizicola sp.]|nr:M48 family metallopeptidase [Tabrizicola sp.]
MTKSFVLIYGDARLPYQVQEDPARSTRIAIHVEPDGTVMVDAPLGYTDEVVQHAVQKRARWITANVTDAMQRFANVRPREYVSGEQVLYLGRRYLLKVVIAAKPSKSARLRGNRLEVESRTGDPDDIKGRVRGWYRSKARDYLAQRLDMLSARLTWVDTTPPFKLLEMTRQWGSCSPSGRIILNPHLIKAPRASVDYVIIHELAHLIHHNHGREFFRVLDREVPDWNNHKQVLDGMVEQLMNE